MLSTLNIEHVRLYSTGCVHEKKFQQVVGTVKKVLPL